MNSFLLAVLYAFSTTTTSTILIDHRYRYPMRNKNEYQDCVNRKKRLMIDDSLILRHPDYELCLRAMCKITREQEIAPAVSDITYLGYQVLLSLVSRERDGVSIYLDRVPGDYQKIKSEPLSSWKRERRKNSVLISTCTAVEYRYIVHYDDVN
eukprot:scaffold33622_cov51-Attheya_sp.AAC.2